MPVKDSPLPPGSATGTCRDFGYTADDHWAKLPPGRSWTEVAAVATDRDDRVYVFARADHAVLIFARDGTLVDSWGEGMFSRPHGISTGPEGAIYCIDDLGHRVGKFTYEGKQVLALGATGQPSDTGATSMDYRTILRAGPPFHYPTNLAVSPNGDLYVSDGYGNARVHRFSAEGRLLHSWGEPGSGPGQFHLPHGIAVDEHGVVYVADRENSRVQLFTPEGTYLAQWTDVARPCQVCIAAGKVYVAELGFLAGMWPGTTAPSGDSPGGRLSIFDLGGNLLARWGGGRNPEAPGDFFAPHGICVDSHGDIYVAEVMMSAGGNRGMVSPTCHALQKFTRQAEANP
jgi:DNA-binding beta-propeller fold protein YncE